jgi:DNA replication protein DnaC
MQKIGSLIGSRIPDLFLVRSDLKGKVEPLEKFREPCPVCKLENGMTVWTYREEGETKRFSPARCCTVCQNDMTRHNDNQSEAITKKWYHIKADDSSGFKNYQPYNGATEKAAKIAKDYAIGVINGVLNRNLVLMGSTGTGKTHLAKTIAKTAKEKGLAVAYLEARELFELIKATFGHERHNKMLFDEFKSFDLVVIDDVGLETKKQNEISWSVSEWTKIADARESKATVYTTNFDDLSLPEIIGQRAFSRMYMNTSFIDLFTDDYRKRK